jgi:amino-acid N-acetyltransferase
MVIQSRTTEERPLADPKRSLPLSDSGTVSYSIRRALDSDISEIMDLIASYPETILPRSADEMRELIGTFWVAVTDDAEIIGCCCLEVYSSKIAEIRSVAVREGFRGFNIGESLVKEAVSEARQRNIRQIMVITSSPEYFQKLNFGQCLNEKFALFWNGQ